MATYLERAKIEQDAKSSVSSIPTGSTSSDVITANRFAARVRHGLIDTAEALIVSSSAGDAKIAWALETVNNPPTTVALNLLMAHFDGDPGANLSVTQIFSSDDSSIRAGIGALLDGLVLGKKL